MKSPETTSALLLRQQFLVMYVSCEYSVRNSLQSSGGPIGPQGSEVQWPLLKLDGPNFLKTN